jgi:uncharacterized protein (TIGR03437 family)
MVALAQPPKITSFVTLATLDNHIGPGSELVIFGNFTSPSAGRDYTITVGGQTTGINVAAGATLILATVPPTAPPGSQTLVISYLGQASNGLPIQVAAMAPEMGGYTASIGGGTPPQFLGYHPFKDGVTNNFILPNAPASRGQVLSTFVNGIGQNIPPGVAPQVTVAGQQANVVQATGSPGNATVYFVVPNIAPLGVDPVVVTVAGVASNTAPLPVGSGPGIGSILNGASFGSPGVVAPGSIVSVFGAGFGSQDNFAVFPGTSANGLSVLFGSTAAPIFALAGAAGQVNAVVPMELPDGPVDVTVKTSAATSAAFPVTVAPAAPGMFYYADPQLITRHNAVAVTANTAWLAMPLSMAATMGIPTNCAVLGAAKLCAQPAHPGDYLQLYVTGLGRATLNGAPNGALLATGSVAPANGNPLYLTVQMPTVTIGGQNAAVVFSGVAPGFAGLYQVDVQIPANAPVGDDIPVLLTSGGITDQATVALR